jgi:hypothetical protein
MKVKYLFLGLFFLTVPGNIFCQNDSMISIDSFRNSFIQQLQLFPQEKIYLHTDKSSYISGETIRFKVYLVDAVVHYPSMHSRFVYVELINPQDRVIRREKVKIASDGSHGQIGIPATLPEGNYTLRAYSGTLYGIDENYFFHKNIYLRSPLSPDIKGERNTSIRGENYELSFFPEGGNLLEGVSCKIAFKAIKTNGLAENIQGSIRDEEGNQVVPSFQSLYKGMGNFMLTPESGKTYYAVVENDNHLVREFKLPPALPHAYALSAQWNGNKIGLSVKHSGNIPADDSLFLVIHSRGIVEYAALWNPSVSYLYLKKEDFPSGILQALLLDKDRNPLSERLLFCINDDQANLSFQINKEHFKAREQVIIDLQLSDKEHNPLIGNFSVSVTDNDEAATDSASNILTYLLLTSDLKGYIESPAFYFETANPLSTIALDNLMLTQGWRRYNLPEIMKGHWEESRGFVELGQEISGSVKGLISGKGIAGSRVSLLSLDNMYADETVTDEKGHFSFVGLDFPDKTNFILQAFSNKGSERVNLSVQEDEFPPVERGFFPGFMEENPGLDKETYREREELVNGVKVIHLQEVEVKAKRAETSNNAYFRMADNSFDRKKIEEIDATCVHELLRRIPGVIVRDDKAIVRSPVSIYGKPYAAIAIDGVIVESFAEENDFDKYTDFDLDQINMADIERVDVYKTGNTVIWGARGGKGVISFTTKRGDFDPSKTDRVRFNTKKISPLGYTVPAEFYSPKYETEEQKANGIPDLRTTLLWKPNIHTNESGFASFDFYTSDQPAIYSVLIEGITTNGAIIHQQFSVCSDARYPMQCTAYEGTD